MVRYSSLHERWPRRRPEKTDVQNFRAVCDACGSDFERILVEGMPSIIRGLGVLLAGGDVRPHQRNISISAYMRNQQPVVDAIDGVYNDAQKNMQACFCAYE